jgi:signal transduction histidine kinase
VRALAAIGYSLVAAAAMNLCFGVFLLARGNRRDPPLPYTAIMAFLSGLYCLVMGIAYVRASLGLDWNLYYRTAWVGWLALAPLGQTVLVMRGEPGRARRWGVILYAVWGAILISCWTTDWIEVGAVSLIPFVDRTGPLEGPVRLLGAATLGYLLFEMYRVRRASVGRRRQQLSYFLLGMAVYSAAGALLAGIPALFGWLHFDPGLVSCFSVVWMACVFYAVTRHRLFDIRFVLSRALFAMVLTGLLAATNVALYRMLQPTIGDVTAVTIVGFLAGVALFMTPLFYGLQRASSRMLLRYDYHRAIRESAQALARLVDVDDVVRTLLDSSRATIGCASGSVLLDQEVALRVAQGFGPPTPPSLPRDGMLARWLSANKQVFVRDEQELALPPDELSAIDGELGPFGGELAVPIGYQGALTGILILGRKTDKDAFLQNDVDLLATMASEAGVALANARLVEELRQAVRVRDDFLSVASHELRTPLTGLQLSVQSLSRADLPPEQVRSRLGGAARQIARLGRLTDELLEVVRISQGRLALERERFDLAALVREVAERFSEELRRTGTALELSLVETVGSWDRTRIDHVLTNLVSNAIKYGRARPITVGLERLPARARVTVRDQGIGIAAADQARIFERFERAVSQQHYGGLGLGLWIVREVVTAHAGTIRVESEPGQGSTFVVELPLDEENRT